MNHFLLVSSKNQHSRTILIDRIAKGISHLVPYEPGQTHILSLSESVIFVAAQSHDVLQLGDRHLYCGNNFIAYDGFCRSKNPQNLTAEIFMNAFREHGAFGVNNFLDGEYCAAHFDPASHRLSGVSDFTGLRPLYHFESERYFAISNRQMFLNPLLTDSEKTSVDVTQIADLIGKGNKFSEHSILKGVRMLRPGFGITFSPYTGVEIRRSGQPIFTARGVPTKSDYVNSVQDIVRNFDALDNIPGLDGQPIRISLTGGEDSRLVLAAALNSRIANRIETFTYGYPDNPDIAAAESVAKKAGVPHFKNIQTPPKNLTERSISDIWSDLRRHAFRFEGAPGAWDGGANSSSQVRLDLVGYFDGYFKRVRPASAAIDVSSRGIAQIFMSEPQQPFDPLGILYPEATQRDRQYCDAWLENILSEGAELNDVPELFYFDFRLPWWGGGMASNSGSLYRIAPLASKISSRTGLKQSIVDRRERRFIFEAMLALRPDLLEMPYLNKKWPDHFQALAPNIKLPRVELQLPAPSHPSIPWQNTLAKKGGGFILDYLNSNSFSDFKEVINFSRLAQFLTNPSLVNNAPIVRSICNLAEILVIAAGDQSRFPDKIVNNHLKGPSRITNLPELAEWASRALESDGTVASAAQPATSTKHCEINLNFPPGPIRNVRIDPSTRPSILSLAKLSLKNADGGFTPLALSSMRNNDQVKTSVNSDGFLQLVVTGNDPHLYFPVGFKFDEISGLFLSLNVQPGHGPLEVFFDMGQGFSRAGMLSIVY